MSDIAILQQSLQYNPECVRQAANDTAILLSDCRRLLSHHNCRTDSDEHRIGNGRERRYGVAKQPALSRSPSSGRSWSCWCRRNNIALVRDDVGLLVCWQTPFVFQDWMASPSADYQHAGNANLLLCAISEAGASYQLTEAEPLVR